MDLKIAVILGSVRSDRQGIKAARYIMRQLEQRGHEAVLVDPLEKRLPLLDECSRSIRAARLRKCSRTSRHCIAAPTAS